MKIKMEEGHSPSKYDDDEDKTDVEVCINFKFIVFYCLFYSFEIFCVYFKLIHVYCFCIYCGDISICT